MVTIKITKFQLGRSYYSNKSNSPLFHLKARDGKELTFTVIKNDEPVTEAKATVKVTMSNSAAQEVARVPSPYGYFDLSASIVLPVGRKMSELPLYEQKLIDIAIKRDCEMRKARG